MVDTVLGAEAVERHGVDRAAVERVRRTVPLGDVAYLQQRVRSVVAVDLELGRALLIRQPDWEHPHPIAEGLEPTAARFEVRRLGLKAKDSAGREGEQVLFG